MSLDLVCPSCGSSHGREERFCPECGMPLVEEGTLGEELRLTPRQERARKVKPQYAEGKLVPVATARNQVESDFIQALLLEEGVPSVVRRAGGFDVPDFLTVGWREVLVAQSGVAAAHDILLHQPAGAAPSRSTVTWPLRLMAGVLLAFVLVGLVLFMATHVAQ